MEKEVSCFLKKVFKIDLLLGLFLTIVGLIGFKTYIFPLFIGYIISIVSFYINSVITNKIIANSNDNTQLNLILGSFLRIILVVTIAGLLGYINPFYLIAYIIGYSINYIALIIYGLTLRNKE